MGFSSSKSVANLRRCQLVSHHWWVVAGLAAYLMHMGTAENAQICWTFLLIFRLTTWGTRCTDEHNLAQAYVAKLKTSVKRSGALTPAQSQHVSGMLDALARCASYSQDAVAVERPEAASAVEVNAADEVKLKSLFWCYTVR